jgi:FkbM family methyltransferase
MLKIFIILIIIEIMLNVGILNFIIKNNVKLINMNLKLKNDFNIQFLNLKKSIKNKNIGNEEFNEIINKEYRKNQINFCRNINEKLIHGFEDRIKLAKVIFNNITYNMFVYKNKDIVSYYISNRNKWEEKETNNIINGLNYYAKKKNLIYKDIYIIDVGGNIGWYTFLLGKYGYNLITFEPSKINYYILNKNFYLNKNSNITIINKGLFPEEKICNIYSAKNNIGNGMINCNEKIVKNEINNGKIILTKFRNYISYFENKNLAMIKMDIEGSEGKALESGIEFITKYHVPFIFIEFTPNLLIENGTNPKKFLEIFIRNGYKINLRNFFEQKVYDIEYLSKKTRNLYIVYTSFLK